MLASPSPVAVPVTVNGAPHQVADGVALDAFLAALNLNPAKVAVERNLEIVPRSRYAETRLEAGDRLEIVQFVGGG